MAVAVPGCGGVFAFASAPCHDTPPTVSRRYSPAPPTQLRPGLMRHLHNLPARRLTNQTVNALTAALTLAFEQCPAQCATSLHNHRVSLPNRCMGPPPRGEGTFGAPVNSETHQKKTDDQLLFARFSLRSGCLLCSWFACVVTSAPDVPAFISCVCCLPAFHDDRAAGTPSHRYLSVSLVIGCPSLVVDGVGAAWPVA